MRINRTLTSSSLGSLILLSLSLSMAQQLQAQIELITFERPFHARHLAGVVVDSGGAEVAGVVVEICDQPPTDKPWECDRDPARALESTTTDANGHFEFSNAKIGRSYYLHFSSRGFNPMQIWVKLRPFARREIQIKMHIAT